MYKNKNLLAVGLIPIALLTIGMLAFLGVPYVEAAEIAQPAMIPPGKATLISPSGATTDTTPTYKWTKVSAATWYYLWVNGPSGNVVQQWYEASAVCGASTCSTTPTTNLTAGNHQWWIQTWNADGYGPWSDAQSFSVGIAPPGKATLISPSGSITDTTPTYTWRKVSTATWYYLWVNGPSGNVVQQWYEGLAVCGASTCSVTPDLPLSGGNHQWWIQTWNPGGYGLWSSAKNFSLPAAGFNSQFNVSSTGWETHAGAWGIAGGQWYTAPGLPNSLYASTSYNGTFSTLDYRARLWRQGSSQNCLVIRGSPTPVDIFNDWDSGYRFCYSQGGYYSVQKRTPDTYWTYLQPYTVSPSIPGGDRWNEVRIVANGSSLYFYINNILIWSGVDSTLISGRVGITISDVSAGGNPLWVDWATLTSVVTLSIEDTISPEQQALNQAALESIADMQVLPPETP